MSLHIFTCWLIYWNVFQTMKASLLIFCQSDKDYFIGIQLWLLCSQFHFTLLAKHLNKKKEWIIDLKCSLLHILRVSRMLRVIIICIFVQFVWNIETREEVKGKTNVWMYVKAINVSVCEYEGTFCVGNWKLWKMMVELVEEIGHMLELQNVD